MPRRALRKIDPELDLSRNFRIWDQMPDPWDQATLFGRTAPLEIEVGSGKGLFLATAAAACPERNFLGIEIAHKYARYAAARLAREELSNAVLANLDALRLFRERLPAASTTAVHVYFPDPWWKARHRKRRVMNAAFLTDVERVLVPGGQLHFWTDVEEYFQSTLELMTTRTGWEGPLPVAEAQARHDLDYRTHFERRMRLHGAPVYRSLFLRTR